MLNNTKRRIGLLEVMRSLRRWPAQLGVGNIQRGVQQRPQHHVGPTPRSLVDNRISINCFPCRKPISLYVDFCVLLWPHLA